MDRDTVLCHCMGVTVGDIIDAIDNGAKDFDEVQEATNCSAGCGGCQDEVIAFIKDYISKKA